MNSSSSTCLELAARPSDFASHLFGAASRHGIADRSIRSPSVMPVQRILQLVFVLPHDPAPSRFFEDRSEWSLVNFYGVEHGEHQGVKSPIATEVPLSRNHRYGGPSAKSTS